MGLDVIVSVRKEALDADFTALRDAAADVLAEATR
jgi:hypothetical protein